jgi:hypothetical protein
MGFDGSSTEDSPPAWESPLVLHGKTTARDTSRDFVAFLKEVVSLCRGIK